MKLSIALRAFLIGAAATLNSAKADCDKRGSNCVLDDECCPGDQCVDDVCSPLLSFQNGALPASVVAGSAFDEEGEEKCGDHGDECDSDEKCCGQHVCVEGECGKPEPKSNFEPQSAGGGDDDHPECGDHGDECESNENCCGHHICVEGGTCGKPEPKSNGGDDHLECGDHGDECKTDENCCGHHICVEGGTCGKPEPKLNGGDEHPECGDHGDECDTDENCCGHHICGGGKCGKPLPSFVANQAASGLTDDSSPGSPNVVNSNESTPVHIESRYLVFYKNEAGRDNLKQNAKLGTLEVDIPLFNMAAAMLTPVAAMAMEADEGNIAKIVVDEFVETDGWDETTIKRNLRRSLSEIDPYGLSMVQADNFRETIFPSDHDPIKVCIVDTGYDNSHADLPNLPDTDGFASVDPLFDGQKWDIDEHGHGTHIAGTIGALGGNDKGVDSILSTGYGSRYSFFIAKGLSDSGDGFVSTYMEGISECVKAGAKVINLSLGGGSFVQEQSDVLDQVFNDGVLLVASAGDTMNDSPHYPSSFSAVMAVASVNDKAERSSFSSFHPQVEIAAPGSSVLSTIPEQIAESNGLGEKSGTSMAAAHVAGVAALVWGYYPECSASQIRTVLLKTAMKTEGMKHAYCDKNYGYGIVQAQAAYDLLYSLGCEGAGGEDADPPVSGWQSANGERAIACHKLGPPDEVGPPDNVPLEDFCSSVSCLNGGECVNGEVSFECNCEDGWEGPLCETNINDCNPSPCGPNGSCVDMVGGYRCDCFQGFNGLNCEKEDGGNVPEQLQVEEPSCSHDVGEKCSHSSDCCPDVGLICPVTIVSDPDKLVCTKAFSRK